ncbi:hypothetical protein GCM10011494_08330 [Novosphingobium endophyticum]|uniref:Short chain dehydrogenase-like proteobacteria domain-containing protein n=1 Tax=Novosphingobium endophyticum TaxID=1955250 RepID=A0A916TSS7_9SPHN|nr:hypothetical protein [Novosphingobium endophyticum]GGB92294.1 hypothetical protein GCM10011494_08330 [Novosphingobium endophyticum]
MELLRVGPLPEEPLAAAADFHSRILPGVEATLGGGADPLTLVFLPGDHEHRGWRLAAVQSLARAYAPSRVNAVESDDEAAIAAAGRWLAAAEGVTGQFLPLDGTGAGAVL